MANNFNEHFTTSLLTNNQKRDFEFLNANIPIGNVSLVLSSYNTKNNRGKNNVKKI